MTYIELNWLYFSAESSHQYSEIAARNNDPLGISDCPRHHKNTVSGSRVRTIFQLDLIQPNSPRLHNLYHSTALFILREHSFKSPYMYHSRALLYMNRISQTTRIRGQLIFKLIMLIPGK